MPATPITRNAARQLTARGDIGAEQSPRRETEGNAEREDGQRTGATLAREIVCDQRIGRSNAAGLANPDAEPGQEELPISRRKAAERGEAAPDGERGGDDPAPAGAVGQIGERNAEHGIEKSECKAADRAELGVGQPEVGLDRLRENAEDLPIEEIEDVGEQKEEEHARRKR